MLTEKSVFSYRKQFPNDDCFFSEPGPGVIVRNKETSSSYISPMNETDEAFTERLERSKKASHNYFYDEWKKFSYKKNAVY